MRVEQAIAGVIALDRRVEAGLNVRSVTFNSQRVEPGDIFVAVPGMKVDASRFVSDALERGAVLVVGTQVEALRGAANWVLVQDARAALAVIAGNVFEHPSRRLTLVAFTGTNGKTSLTYLGEAVAVAAGRRPGIMGTVECRFAGRSIEMKHTTPEAPVFQAFLREMADAGADCAFVEASSHGIALKRVDGTEFAIAVFTNLSQDHLDFHRTMEEYAAAKFELFTRLLRTSPRRIAAVVNVDDAYGRQLAGLIDYPLLTYGLDEAGAAVRAVGLQMSHRGLTFEAVGPWGSFPVTSPLVGRHNASNILSIMAVAHLMGIAPAAAAAGVASLTRIAGRLEAVDNPFGVGIWVDYCHTPDAIEKVLLAVRPVVSGRLITVLGAGGDRDRVKRPKMGAVAERMSDIAVVTSDNPRSENELSVIEDILSGMSREYRVRSCVVIPDRALAIEAAVGMARRGDGIVIGGKGAETYIERFGVRTHFDDREEARKAVKAAQERSA